MPHIAYIDPDEEIISVVGRLRKVGDAEVCFVVPKRALFLQSLVNLRLLERESKKLGKRLCLVTPDDAGRALAEKAGIETKSSLEGVDGMSPNAGAASLPARLSRVDHVANSEKKDVSSDGGRSPLLHSESIGSSSFFMKNESAVPAPLAPLEKDEKEAASRFAGVEPKAPSSDAVSLRTIPVRDRTPKRLTTLNSVRSDSGSVSSPQASVQAPLSETTDVNRSASLPVVRKTPNRPSTEDISPSSSSGVSSRISFNFPAPVTPLSPPLPRAPQMSNTPSPTTQSEKAPEAERAGASITRFYQGRANVQSGQKDSNSEVPVPLEKDRSVGGRRLFRRIVFSFIAISLLVATGVSLVIFLPRAEVTVVMQTQSESADLEIIARTEESSGDVEGKTIPLRLIETEKDITQSFPGTGKSSVSDKRARGLVTLSNAFGASAQPLVATTRLESPNGKIFRLVKGVTVPGTKEKNGETVPGTIEAEVVADTAGEEYNIEPGSFTIPGLKGSAKYEKITAVSTKAFAGGGSGTDAIASVSADDVIRAKEASEKKLTELLRAELEKDLEPGEKLLDDAILSETLSSGAFPGAGAVAPSFDYRMRVSARALVFSESDVRKAAEATLGDGAKADDLEIEYTVPRPDFVAKSLLVKARASFLKQETIDVERIKRNLLGKSVAEVQGIFAEYPNIEKIEVVFWPKFLTNRIPSRASQVEVNVKTP